MRNLVKKNLVVAGYEYLFYKIYTFMWWPNSRNKNLQYATILWMTIFLCANVLIFFELYDFFSQEATLILFTGSLKWSSFILVPAFFINYLLFIHKDKYKKIIKYYKDTDDVQSKWGDRWAWAYIFFSMFGLIILELLRIILINFLKIA